MMQPGRSFAQLSSTLYYSWVFQHRLDEALGAIKAAKALDQAVRLRLPFTIDPAAAQRNARSDWCSQATLPSALRSAAI